MYKYLIWFENLKTVFSKEKIFEITPAPTGNYLYTAILFGLVIIAAILLHILFKKQSKNSQKVWGRLIPLLWFTGITELFLIFFRWQSIPYLGSRFLMLMMFSVAVLWLAQILWFKFVELPQELSIKKKKQEFEKYLPRKR